MIQPCLSASIPPECHPYGWVQARTSPETLHISYLSVTNGPECPGVGMVGVPGWCGVGVSAPGGSVQVA